MYFVSIYINRRMKPVEIVLRRGKRGRERMMEGANLRYIVSTYVNITMHYPAQLLYANKIILKNIISKEHKKMSNNSSKQKSHGLLHVIQ
jgi:hypothetical protein